MKSEWTTYTVQELIDKEMLEPPMDGNHGEIHPKTTDYVKSGVPFIMANNLINGKVDYSNCAFITNKQASTLKKGFAHPGDVLLTHKATIGRTALVGTEYDTIILTPQVTYYRVKRGISNLYLKYYFDSNEFQQTLANWAGSGSTRAYLGITAQRKLPVVLPPLEIQTKIAEFGRILDDKIELNNKINENLEQQAQAYFDELFIVNAKPNWPYCALSDIGSIVAGGTPSKSKSEYYAEQGIAWITPKDLSIDKSKFISHGENDISELGFSKSSATKMPAGTVLFSSRAPIGYIAIAQNEITTNQGFKSVIPHENIGTTYVYFLLKKLLPTIEGMASGSTFKEISGAGMKSVPTVMPDADTIQCFNTFCQPIFNEQEILEAENRRLSALRDSLLPKLMSGEIDVSTIDL